MKLFTSKLNRRQQEAQAALEAHCAKAVEESEKFLKLTRFLLARIADQPNSDELLQEFKGMFGQCDVTGFGIVKPVYMPCEPEDLTEMHELAQRWRSHPDFRAEWSSPASGSK